MATRRPGRPKKRASDRRSVDVHIMVTPRQRRDLARLARAEGVSLSTFLLGLGLRELRRSDGEG